MTKIRDLIAADEALETAEEEARRYDRDPRQWSAFESMDKRGKRTLNLEPAHFERRALMSDRVKAAQVQLLAHQAGVP